MKLILRTAFCMYALRVFMSYGLHRVCLQFGKNFVVIDVDAVRQMLLCDLCVCLCPCYCDVLNMPKCVYQKMTTICNKNECCKGEKKKKYLKIKCFGIKL